MLPVLIATILRPRGETGVQTHFRTLMESLRGMPQRLELVTPYDAPLWQVYPSFAVRWILQPLHKPSSVLWYREVHAFYLRRALTRRLRDGSPCVIYAQCPLSADAALRSRRSFAQKVVMATHFNLSQADEWAGKGMISTEGRVFNAIRAFEFALIPQLDGLVFVSEFIRDELSRRIPAIGRMPAVVVPNFVTDPGPPVDIQRASSDLICVGTLEARKNQFYALDILATARSLGRRLTLTIVGDGPLRGALAERVTQLGLNGQVQFMGRHNAVAELYPMHRASLLVSTLETFGIVLVESMAAGRPVFACPVGGVPEVFSDGSEGRFLPQHDPHTAADRIVEWLDDEHTLRRASMAARERFLRDFEAIHVSRQLLGFLMEIPQAVRA